MFRFIPSWNYILQGDLNDPRPKPIETTLDYFFHFNLHLEMDGSLYYSFVLSWHNQPQNLGITKKNQPHKNIRDHMKDFDKK